MDHNIVVSSFFYNIVFHNFVFLLLAMLPRPSSLSTQLTSSSSILRSASTSGGGGGGGSGSGIHTPDQSGSPHLTSFKTSAFSLGDDHTSEPPLPSSVRFSGLEDSESATATVRRRSFSTATGTPVAMSLSVPDHPPSPLHTPYQSAQDWTHDDADIEAATATASASAGGKVGGAGRDASAFASGVASGFSSAKTGGGGSGSGSNASGSGSNRGGSGSTGGAGGGGGGGGASSSGEGGAGGGTGLGYLGELMSQAKDQMAAGMAAGLTPEQVGGGGWGWVSSAVVYPILD